MTMTSHDRGATPRPIAREGVPQFIRTLGLLCSLIIGSILSQASGAQAEILRYRNADGHVHFTDTRMTRSGQQPRHKVAPSSPSRGSARSMQRAQLVVLAHRLARQYAIDEHLVQAIITVESNFNPYAVSRAGAQGLMQLMPATAMRYNVDDPFDPRANVEGGVRYIKDLLQRYAGDVRWALAAYNAGEGAVARYGGIPPFPETRQYVKRVMALYSPMYQPYRLQKIYRYPTRRGGILFTDTPRSW